MTYNKGLKLDKILWVDLEMTGLDVEEDLILEVAAIVTDWDFQEIATYQGVVKNATDTLKLRIDVNKAFWDANLEARDGLLEQNKNGKPLEIIEDELLAFLNKNFDKQPVLLAGNSVHMDRRFIIEKWPRLEERLFYRMLDVSAWKVVFEHKFHQKFAKPDDHRALEDIRGSILELKYYLSKLK